MNQLLPHLLRLDRKVLLLTVGCIAVFILLEAWLLVFRQPVAALTQLQNENTKLAQLSLQGTDLSGHIVRLSGEIEQLSQQLYGQKAAVSAQQRTLQLVASLDRLASASQVEIVSIKPLVTPVANDFQQIELQVEASGDYLLLAKWIQGLQAVTPPVIFDRIQIKTNASGGNPQLQMRLLSFVPAIP